MQRKAEDAHRLRLKAQEMLRLARQTAMPEVAEELVEMASLLHERATKTEAALAQQQRHPEPQPNDDAE